MREAPEGQREFGEVSGGLAPTTSRGKRQDGELESEAVSEEWRNPGGVSGQSA